MNLFLVDKNISYANMLKKVFEERLNVESIAIFGDLAAMFKTNKSKNLIVLFETNEFNMRELRRHLERNKNNTINFVAFTRKPETGYLMDTLLSGVTSIIYKTEKVDVIVSELNTIIRGKGVLPQKIIEAIKDKISLEKRVPSQLHTHNFLKKITTLFNNKLVETK